MHLEPHAVNGNTFRDHSLHKFIEEFRFLPAHFLSVEVIQDQDRVRVGDARLPESRLDQGSIASIHPG